MNRATRRLPAAIHDLQFAARGYERCRVWALAARAKVKTDDCASLRRTHQEDARYWAGLARNYYRDGMAAAALLDR